MFNIFQTNYVVLSFSLMLSFYLFLSCTNSDNQDTQTKRNAEIENAYKEVMRKHDEVMPKISDIRLLQKQLREEMEKDSIVRDSLKKENILELLSKLKKADDAMFDWMNDFKNPHLHQEFYLKSKDEELLIYLKSEDKKIEEVANQMLESIQLSKNLLKK